MKNKKFNSIIEKNLPSWVSRQIIRYFKEGGIIETIIENNFLYEDIERKFLLALKKGGRIRRYKSK